MRWTALKEPPGFMQDHPPHTATIEQLPEALAGWAARVSAHQDMSAAVDGKRAKQSEDAQGNPPVMVNVLAHYLKLCLAQWPAPEKRCEPGVLREQPGRLYESLFENSCR